MFQLRYVIGLVAGLLAASSVSASIGFNEHILTKRDDSAVSNSTTGWFEQPIDHFNNNTQTWLQRYMINTNYYQPGGPLLIITPGESELSDLYTEYTYFTELAAKMNGMIIAIEHRYFGQSNPLPDLSPDSLKYLTLENTLEDFARFIRTVRNTPQSVPPLAVVSVNSTVVFVGGSYGGSIAAWMRAKYPELVHAAWASSAPVASVRDFYQLDQSFGQHLEMRGCAQGFAQAISDMDGILLSKNATAVEEIQKEFGMSGMTAEMFARQLANVISGQVNTPVKMDDDMVDRTVCMYFDGLRAPLMSYQLAINAISMGYEPPGIFSKSRKTGHHGLQKRTDTGNTDVSVNQAYRSWSYISCTWFANWQVAAPKELNLTSYRSQLLTADLWEQTECATAFGSSVALPVDVARHNSKWLDILKSVSRIYYTAGEFDPWRGATLGAEDKDKEIMGTGGGNGTDTVVYVMSGATHTQEMYLTDQNDLVSVKAARQLGDQLIMKWTLGSAGTE